MRLVFRMYAPEQELAVQVTQVDGIHINHINVFEARKGEVLQNFATKASSTNHQDLGGGLPVMTGLREGKRRSEKMARA